MHQVSGTSSTGVVSVSGGVVSNKEISEKEFAQRVAIVKRFRELLVEQRERFSNYLSVLDKQKQSIESGNTAAISEHIKMEEKIVSDIFTIQKSIEPMTMMFEDALRGGISGGMPDVKEIRRSLDTLKADAAHRVDENKKLLREKMTALQGEIKAVRKNPFKSKRRALFSGGNTSSLVDIRG